MKFDVVRIYIEQMKELTSEVHTPLARSNQSVVQINDPSISFRDLCKHCTVVFQLHP